MRRVVSDEKSPEPDDLEVFLVPTDSVDPDSGLRTELREQSAAHPAEAVRGANC